MARRLAQILFCCCFCKLAFCEIFITFPSDALNPLGQHSFFRPRLGNTLCTFIPAYFIAKAHNATLVRMPMDIDIYSKINKRVKTISYSDFYKIKKFISLKNRDFKNLDPSENYLYKQCFILKYRGSLSDMQKQEMREIFFTNESSRKINKIPGSSYIGLHVRTGEGFDFPLKSTQFYSKKHLLYKKSVKHSGAYLDVIRPEKAPPLQYFLDGINYFTEHISSKVIFVLFTDSPNPEKIISELKRRSHKDITILNIHSIKEIRTDFDDILGMIEMDGLILPKQSTFSIVPLEVSNYDYVIKPISYKWLEDCLVMDKLEVSGEKVKTHTVKLY